MRVRKLDPAATATPSPVAPAATPSATPAVTGALFLRATDVLAFVAAVSGAGLAESLACQHDAAGRWWVEVPCAPRQAVPLVILARGRPFTGGPRIWRSVRSDGQPLPGAAAPADPTVTTLIDGPRVEALQHWWGADLRELMSEVQLPSAPLVASPEVWVLAPAALARILALRALGLGLAVELAPAEHRDLRDETPARPVVAVRVRGPSVARAWQRAAVDLPEVLVATPVGERLLVEAGARLPLGHALLANMVPADECWLLDAGEGARRLTLLGEFTPAAPLLVEPAADPPKRTPAPTALPPRTAVRVVRTDAPPGELDAVWLDARELGWLATWLMGHPLADHAFLLPAGDRGLLLGPRALLLAAPLGIPLTRLGPGALLVERGHAILPPLSPAARESVFGALTDTALVLGPHTDVRIPLADLVPAWTLWAGDPPAITDSLPTAAQARLQALARTLAAPSPPPTPPALAPGDRRVVDQEHLRGLAAAAELRGHWAEAARLREQIGDYHHAARMYERAAAQE